jgi:hypothetical protein
MAIINKTGITTGGTIQAEHVTRTIDALSGVSTDTIIASGSFTGSLTGTVTATQVTVANSFAASGSHLSVTSPTMQIGNAGSGTAVTLSNKSGLNLQDIVTGTGVILPRNQCSAPATGSVYFDYTGPTLWIYDGTNWRGFEPTLP